MQLGLRYDFSALWGAGGYRPSVTLGLGMGLPTGRQETFGEGDETTLVATGFATYSTRAQLGVTQFVTKSIGLQAWVSASAPITRTAGGLHPGNRAAFGASGLWRTGGQFALSGGITGSKTGRADGINGTIINSGSTMVSASFDATWIESKGIALTVGGRKPLYSDVNGRQPSEAFSLSLGCIITLGVEDEPEEHQPGPASVPATATPDVRVAAVGGSSFDATTIAVAGKVTVVDFWADWCAPCKVLGKALTELAAKHPNLAIRMVEVPDFDSEVATAHLPGIDALPSAWVIMPNGQKQVLGGQTVDAILDAVLLALDSTQ